MKPSDPLQEKHPIRAAAHLRRLHQQNGDLLSANIFERLPFSPVAEIRVNEPEPPLAEAQRRRPHPAGVRPPAQVELRLPGERMADHPPVHEVTRVVEGHSRKPLERARCDEVVVSLADDGWVRSKAREDRIVDFCHLRI